MNINNIVKNSSNFLRIRQWFSVVLVREHSRKIMENLPLKINLSDRLSSLVRPSNYNIILRPNFKDHTFQGNVKIDINVKEDRKHVALHSHFLDIKSVKVSKNNSDIPVSKFMEVKQLEQLIVFFENPLNSGNYRIEIDYSGNLKGNLVGFYSSRLADNSTMVASKFQPTYARQAFPCFDEPDFKATFDVTLVKPTKLVALSNMNEISVTRDESKDLEIVSFAKSVPMSSYLACFVICDFANKQAEVNSNGIGKNFTLRTFAQKKEIHKIDFALDIGKRATEFYIQYYDVPFPLSKLDMIGIPDYISGATEHWGLVTYRETSFLIDPAEASSANKIAVANTIAHELAHMWFGNLVTVKWWDELWLNEGFATYMQVKALNAIEPSWTMLDQFLTRTLHGVLVIDAKLSSHPIVQVVDTPDQITAIFDAISYRKGSSILRMIEGFTGAENFRRAVSDYLKKFEFGNTITKDLLACMEPYFKKDNPTLNISYIVDTWTRQMGYPLLTVTKGEQPNTYIVTQKRFLLDPSSKYPNDSSFNYRWFVPITYTTNKGRYNKILWFPDTKDNVKITLKEEESWLKLNNDQMGYYRVTYPVEMWETLTEELKSNSSQLTLSDRAHLLNEVFALAEAAVVPYKLALDLSTYLVVEKDYVPWETAAGVFGVLNSRLKNVLALSDLHKYVQKIVTPLYEKQSWDNPEDDVIKGLLRTKIFALALHNELPVAEQKVSKLLLRWMNSYNTSEEYHVEPDLRKIVYTYGMKHASMAEWDKLFEIYNLEEDVQEKAKLRVGLAAPRDAEILRKYLNLAWDERYVRSQDYLNVLKYISDNPSGTGLVWEHVRLNWPQLVDRYSLNSRYLGNMIPDITHSFDTQLRLQEMESFFEQYPEAGAGAAARRRSLETVRNNMHWSATHIPKIAAWLKTARQL